MGIFWICFLAASVLPMGSEPAVAAMAAASKNIWMLLLVASIGNYLGSLTNYAVGRWGGDWSVARFFKVKPAAFQKARRFYTRWGAPTLFFAWVPVVGDPLTILAGIFKIHPLIFTLWVLPGKTLRYFIIIKGIKQVMTQ